MVFTTMIMKRLSAEKDLSVMNIVLKKSLFVHIEMSVKYNSIGANRIKIEGIKPK